MKRIFRILNLIAIVLIVKILGPLPAFIAFIVYYMLENKYGSGYSFLISTIVGISASIFLTKYFFRENDFLLNNNTSTYNQPYKNTEQTKIQSAISKDTFIINEKRSLPLKYENMEIFDFSYERDTFITHINVWDKVNYPLNKENKKEISEYMYKELCLDNKETQKALTLFKDGFLFLYYLNGKVIDDVYVRCN